MTCTVGWLNENLPVWNLILILLVSRRERLDILSYLILLQCEIPLCTCVAIRWRVVGVVGRLFLCHMFYLKNFAEILNFLHIKLEYFYYRNITLGMKEQRRTKSAGMAVEKEKKSDRVATDKNVTETECTVHESPAPSQADRGAAAGGKGRGRSAAAGSSNTKQSSKKLASLSERFIINVFISITWPRPRPLHNFL